MKPETRNILGWIMALLPVSFLLSCINVVKFMAGAASRLIQEKHITSIPAPTQLLLTNVGLAAALPLCLGLVFGVALLVIKRRFKDEADRLTWELVAHTGVWFAAIFYYCGVSMAAFLPWAIAVNH